jgi:PTH1 family peptidyl-tRNA hydrolase
MWLIAGLGNPGSKYLLTRHNIGFMALDYLVKSIGAESAPTKIEHKSIVTSIKWDDKQVILAKPQTYMNVSGESVVAIAQYYKIPTENILVVCDDLDQSFNSLKIKTKSGDGGHNGLKSIIEKLGSNEFARMKLGIGRPTIAQMDIADYVLQKFSKEEQEKLPDFLNVAVDAMESFVFDGVIMAMNKFNSKK